MRDPLKPGEFIAVDFVGPLPVGSECRYILVVIDVLSRYIKALPCTEVSSMALLRGMEEWVWLRKNSQRVLIDSISYMIAWRIEQWFKNRNIFHYMMAPHSHKSNGAVERGIRTLVGSLQHMYYDKGHKQWMEVLTEALEAINTTPNRITGMTPKDVWRSGPRIRKRIHEVMREIRQANNRQRKTKRIQRQFYKGQSVWVYDYVRMK